MKKKMLSLALALIICLGLTVPAFAASQKTISVQYADSKDNSGLTVSSSRTAPAGEEKNASLRLESDGLTETGAFYEAWGDDLTGPYPVYSSTSPVKVTLTEGCTKEETLQYIASGEFEGGVSTLCVDKVTYNEADKSITVLQENAAFFEGMIYFDGKNPCTIREYYSQDEDTHEEYFWSAPSIEIGSSVTLSQPGTYRVSESWSNAYGSTQALIVISENQPAAPGGVDLSGNKYLKVSKNPISWERYQKERMVELAFEGHRFWDVRRWKEADKYFKQIKGMEITKDADGKLHYEVKVINNRLWDDKMYLYPLPQSEIQKNPNLEQNPGW